jgi:hypothetical protein
MSRVGIWCVDLRAAGSRRGWSGPNDGRLAMRGDKILTFDTEAEAQAEVVRLRAIVREQAKRKSWDGRQWIFFTLPLRGATSGAP